MIAFRPAHPALALALAFALAAPHARADDTADEAEFRFRRAAELYGKARYDEALSEFFASNRLVRNRNVIFNIARCFEQLGQANEAYRYYNDLQTEQWSTEDRAALDEALRRMRPKVALVRVASTPPGANVYVDRKDLGSRGLTPRTIALPPGAAKLIVELEGHRVAERAIVLEKGKELPVELPLERIWAWAAVTTDPPGAQVRTEAGSETICETPCEAKLLPGRHVLVVSREGFLPARREVELAFDEHEPVQLRLAPRPPPTGKIVVTANREGALVSVDGLEAGFTPVVVDDVPVGEHTVVVSYDELETWRAKVTVAKDASASVRARLSVPAPRVVAAAKTLTSAEESASSITVITAEEIRAFGYRTLAQALRGVRGLYYTDDRQYEMLGIRGFQPLGDLNTRILVLVDGHPFNDVWAGQAGLGYDFDVDLSQVERIEVVRGPGSALYGSAAVFGVVNVVHRTAPRRGNVEVEGGIGSLGAQRIRATAGIERGSYSASVSAAGFGADGAPTTLLPGVDEQAPVPAIVTGHDHERARHVSAFARAGQVSLVAGYNERARGIPTYTYERGEDRIEGSNSRDVRGFAELRWERPLAREGALAARAYLDATRYTASWAYSEGTYDDRAGAEWAGAELRWRAPTFGSHRLTLGAEYQRWLRVAQTTFDATEVYLEETPHTADILSAYVLDEWRLSPRLALETGLGARVSLAGGTPEKNANPRIALVARPYEGGLTKAVVGRAFRSPNIYERFYNDGGTTWKAAGPLVPEVIYSAELEHTHRVDEELVATFGVFANQLENVLNLEQESDAAIVVFRNSAQPFRALGAEGEVRWQPSRLTLASFSYSFQYSRDPARAGQPLPNSPAHLASLRGMHRFTPALTGAVEATYGGPRLTRDGKALTGETLQVSAAISGEWPKLGLHYSLAAHNLLDDRTEVPLGSGWPALVPRYGRAVQLTVGYAY